MLVLLLVLVLD